MLNSLTELYVKFNSQNKLQIDEQLDNDANEDVNPNVKNPSYIDNGPPPYTETARMARYIVHYSGIMITIFLPRGESKFNYKKERF